MKKSGFTFIELLFTVTIMAVISAITLAKYNDFTERKKLETDAYKLVDVIELAKKKSITGDLYSSCSNFQGYSINITLNSYSLRFYCNGGYETIASYNFSTNNSVTSGEVNWKFNPIYGQLDTAASLTLQNSQSGKEIIISIAQSGLVTTGQIN